MLNDFYTILSFCRAKKKNRVYLVRLSSVIELSEKFQLDYVLLPNQSKNNPTGSIS